MKLSTLSATAVLAAVVAFQPANAQRLTPPSPLPGLIQQVQSGDSFQVIEMQEEVRRLNGKVEELNFLLLQLQEKVRKMEEDNELRFQELEEKRSDASSDTDKPSEEMAQSDNSGDQGLEKPDPSRQTIAADGNTDTDQDTQSATETETNNPSANKATDNQSSRAPRALGTLTFDKNGNVVDSGGGSDEKLIGLPGVFGEGSDGAVEASEFGATPSEVLSAGRALMQNRDHKRATQAFAAHVKAWPKDPETGEARYYLGESLFWQKDYYRAADTHLETHNAYPESSTAAENLLYLGLSLAGLNQREVACATYAEVLKQYPDAAERLGERVKDEQAGAKC